MRAAIESGGERARRHEDPEAGVQAPGAGGGAGTPGPDGSRLRHPTSRLIRIPVGLLLVLGGVFSILPASAFGPCCLGCCSWPATCPFYAGPSGGSRSRLSRNGLHSGSS